MFSACKKDFDPGTTPVSGIANEWWATFSSGGQDLIGHPVKISTYNSANKADSIWVDDLKNGYGFKVLAHWTGNTFETATSANQYYVGTPAFPATVKITNGKILPKAGKSTTGIVVDSIYLEAVFSDDPTTKYIYSGTARTNWPADDH